MTGEQVGRPALPITKDFIEHERIGTTAQSIQQFRSRWRRAGARVEHGNFQLSVGKRCVHDRQVADDDSQEGKAHPAFQNGQQAGGGRYGRNVAQAQSKESLATKIKQLSKGDGLIAELHVFAEPELQECKTENQPNGPEHQQGEQ